MCFEDLDRDYEWYVDSETQTVETATEPRRCCECQRLIDPGEVHEHTHQIGSNDGEEDDEDYPDETCGSWRYDWHGYTCAACCLTRWRVHAHELAEGCQESSSWCPYGELEDYCFHAKFEKATREEGLMWLMRKVGA